MLASRVPAHSTLEFFEHARIDMPQFIVNSFAVSDPARVACTVARLRRDRTLSLYVVNRVAGTRVGGLFG